MCKGQLKVLQNLLPASMWRREGGAGGGGASAPGPGPVVGAGAKLDFSFFLFDRKSVGDPGF